MHSGLKISNAFIRGLNKAEYGTEAEAQYRSRKA